MQKIRKILGANSEKNSERTNGLTDMSQFIGPGLGPTTTTKIAKMFKMLQISPNNHAMIISKFHPNSVIFEQVIAENPFLLCCGVTGRPNYDLFGRFFQKWDFFRKIGLRHFFTLMTP